MSDTRNQFRRKDELSLLACEAAIDLDNLLLKRNRDLSRVRNLADHLRNTVPPTPANGTRRFLTDAATFSVLSAAVQGSSRSTTVKKMGDVFDRVAEMAELLSSDDLVSNPEKQKEAKNLCLALSKAAIGYPRSIYDPSETHPYQR